MTAAAMAMVMTSVCPTDVPTMGAASRAGIRAASRAGIRAASRAGIRAASRAGIRAAS